MKKLSLIIPCYNEGKKLTKNVEKIVSFMEENFLIDYEIMIVNDGSTDNTIDDVLLLKEKYPNIIRLIHYKDNKGKGYAVKRGILDANGDISIFMDADLSTDISIIPKTVKELENYPIVIGSRRMKQSEIAEAQTGIRKITGAGCKVYTNMKLGLHLSDTQCGFKGFHTDIAKQIAEKLTINHWAFDAEMLYIAKLNKIPIKEIPVKCIRTRLTAWICPSRLRLWRISPGAIGKTTGLRSTGI